MENTNLTTFVFTADCMDEYQRGFISGIMYLLTDKPSETYAWARGKNAEDGTIWIKDLVCTTEQALAIHDEVERLFPGVIIEMS